MKIQARSATRAKAAAAMRETLYNPTKEFWLAYGKAGGGIGQADYIAQELERLKKLEENTDGP